MTYTVLVLGASTVYASEPKNADTGISVPISYNSSSKSENASTTYYETEIRTPNLGNYAFDVEAFEKPSHEILPIVGKEYFPSTIARFTTEVDNTNPSATYKANVVSKVDVVFAIGETNQQAALVNYIPTFTNLLQSSGNNIEASVKQVETSTIDMSEFGAREIFNSWRKMPVSTGRGDKIWKLQESEGKIYAEGVRTLENRHTSVGIIDDSKDGFNTTDFSMGFTHNTKGPNGESSYRNVYNGWSPHNSGAIFRYTEDSGGTWDAYMLVIGDSSTNYSSGTGVPFCAVIKIDGGDADFLPGTYAGSLPVGWSAGVLDKSGNLSSMRIDHQGLTYTPGVWCKGERSSRSDMLLMGARAIVNTKSHDFKIECTGNNIKVYCGGILQLDVTDNYGTPYTKGTYGLFSYSSPNIYFSNFKIERGTTMSLGEAISDVAWRSEATRFIVHATDIVPDDFKNPNSSEYAYTVTKLMDSNAYLINIGVDANRAALDGVIKKISGSDGEVKGTFFESNRPNVSTAMVRAKDYIVAIAKRNAKPTDYVLVGDKLIWETQYKDNEMDLPLNFGDNEQDIKLANAWGVGTALMGNFKDDQILAEKWRYKHKSDYYDNGIGKESFDQVWLKDPIEIFNKPGEFRINYKRRDNPFTDNFSVTSVFDSYRYWSIDYDRRKGDSKAVEKYTGLLAGILDIQENITLHSGGN